jgi:hypothetical protein
MVDGLHIHTKRATKPLENCFKWGGERVGGEMVGAI